MASHHLSATERLERAAQRGDVGRGYSANVPVVVPTEDRLGKVAVFIIAIYLVAKMIYLFSGGSVQPADAVLALLAVVLVSPRALLRFLREQAALTGLVLWIAIVNGVWFALTAKANFLPAILYYMFNILIVLAVFGARARKTEMFDKLIPRAIMLAIFIQTLVVIFDSGAGMRAIGTFRNANQLAYWGLLMVSILLVIRRNQPRMFDLPFIVMATYCEYASGSRAGLSATLILLLMWLFFALNTPVKKVVGLSLATALAIGILTSTSVTRFAEYEGEESRFARWTEGSSTGIQFEERNYDRIFKYYEYTIFGAGEGYLTRFQEDKPVALEIHSSFGTMLFSYGVPGLALFLLFILGIFRHAPFSIAMYLVPALIYGLTHQGLRFTLFWILVGIIFSIARAYSPVVEPLPASDVRTGPRRRDAAFLRALALRA